MYRPDQEQKLEGRKSIPLEQTPKEKTKENLGNQLNTLATHN